MAPRYTFSRDRNAIDGGSSATKVVGTVKHSLPSMLLAALCVTFCAGEARAVERQHHLGIAPGATFWKTADSPMELGASLGAFYTYGINDQINLLGELRGSVLTFSRDVIDREKNAIVPTTRPGREGSLALGLAYVLDVLRWVPYGGVLLGAQTIGGGTMTESRIMPTLQVALGLDYQANRTVSVGFAFRQSIFALNASEYPTATHLFAKVEFSWGY